MCNYKKFSVLFLVAIALFLVGSFSLLVPKVYAAAGPNTITKTDVTPGTQPGTFTGVPVYRLHVFNASVDTNDYVDTLYPTPSGSVVDTLVRLHFYNDANNNGIVDGGDTDLLPGGALFGSDNAGQTFDITNVLVPFSGSANILITADGTGLANTGTFLLSIASTANVGMVNTVVTGTATGANLNALTINTTATITSAKVTGPNQVTIVFSGPVDWVLGNFTNLNIGGAKTLSYATQSPPSSTVTITFTGSAVATNATGTIDIAAISDLGSGNTFPGALGQVLSDGQNPTVVITDNTPGIANIASGDVTYTFTYSEPVWAFNGDDPSLSSGTKGAFTGVYSDTVYTLVVTPDPNFEGDMTVDVGENAGHDAATPTQNAGLAALTSHQTVDTKVPAFTALYPKQGIAQADGSQFVEILTKTGEGGTAYYVVDVNGATAPSATQVMAGFDSTGHPAIDADNEAVTANVENNFITAALGADATAYDVYVVVKDAANNPTVATKVDVTTPDALDPTADVTFTLTTPAENGTTNHLTGGGATYSVNADVVNGTTSVVITGTKTVGQTVVVAGMGEPLPRDDSYNVIVTGTTTNPIYTVNTVTNGQQETLDPLVTGDNVSFGGGNKTFILTVSEAGKSDIVYTINVQVATPATPLAQVTGAALSVSGVATWDNLSNESSFNAQLYKDAEPSGTAVTVAANTTTHDFLSAMRAAGAGDYTVTVTAIGDGVTYSNGPESNPSSSQAIIQLDTVSAGLTWTGDTAHWTAVSNGVSYDVQLYKGAPASGVPVNVSAAMIAGGVDFTSAIAAAGSGTYTYKVAALGNATLVLDALAASAASNTNITITATAIAGVTPPVTDATPDTTGDSGTGYTVTSIAWSPDDGTFAGGTEYTATITIAPATGYTLTGITENQFADGVSGATTVTNPADSGVITAIFPATATSIVVPTLTTKDTATQITKTTATIGGAVIDLGGENAFERGFKYGLTLDYENYTNETDSFGATEFSANLTDLKCGKTYHFESYASNSSGTGYGPDQTFATLACVHSSSGGYLPGYGPKIISSTSSTSSISSTSSTSSTPPILISCLIYGSTNELVKEKTRGINAKGVQNAINQMKAVTPPLINDGVIGPLSEAGIKNAQKILLVNPDGIWGPKTQQAYVLFIKKQCSAV